MTCFTITLVHPTGPHPTINLLNAIGLRKHIHRFRADKTLVIMRSDICKVTLCDEEAAAFLRDLPAPFFVASVSILSPPTLVERIFYLHSRIRRERVPPPHRNKILMDVFWNAMACETNFRRQV